MKKVLIVEDDRILLLLNKQIVANMGYMVVGAVHNGQQAIDMARKTNPDYILMDIRIEGGIDGIETAKKISEFSPAHIVYFSGNSDKHTLERAKETNMLAFLIKPVSMEMLKEAIEQEIK